MILKVFGASMAASGAVALFHIDGVTPEAKAKNMLKESAEKMEIESLEAGYASTPKGGHRFCQHRMSPRIGGRITR